MNSKKIFGWLLLIVGLMIIFCSLYFSFNIFIDKAQAPEIFKLEENNQKKILEGIDMQEQMEEMVENQIKKMIPSEFISKLLNLISWSIFAGILIFAGSRVAGIGVKLIRRDF